MSPTPSSTATDMATQSDITSALAAKTFIRIGVAAKVMRIVPWEYSCAIANTPNTPHKSKLTIPVFTNTLMTIVSSGFFANIADNTVTATGKIIRTIVAVIVERNVRNLMNSLFIRCSISEPPLLLVCRDTAQSLRWHQGRRLPKNRFVAIAREK